MREAEDERDAAAAAALEQEAAADLAEFNADPVPAATAEADGDDEDAEPEDGRYCLTIRFRSTLELSLSLVLPNVMVCLPSHHEILPAAFLAGSSIAGTTLGDTAHHELSSYCQRAGRMHSQVLQNLGVLHMCFSLFKSGRWCKVTTAATVFLKKRH